MVDVNYLGKVNYFKNEFVAGNRYLKAVADAIKSGLRDGDVLYRYGGDEFMVQLDKVSPEETKTIMSRINQAVADSPEARAVFTAQRNALAEEYRAVKQAGSFSDLSSSFRESLNSDALKMAQADFLSFRTQFLANQEKAIQTMAKMRPTVSIGSTMVRAGDDVDTVAMRASKQVGTVKGAYKQSLGLDAEKYGTSSVGGVQGGPHPEVPDVLLPN